MANDGKRLNDDEVREYLAYAGAGIAAPDKFAGVVIDATDPRGIVYRQQTAEEGRAAEEAIAAAAEAAAADAALAEQVRAEAQQRTPAPPSMPGVPEQPTDTEKKELAKTEKKD